jgi:26S proteasome regulatory subunit N7
MGPYFKLLVEEFPDLKDDGLQQELDAKNAKTLEEWDAKIEDATQNLGETEVSDALIAKAQYLAKIGQKVSPVPISSTANTLSGRSFDCL